MSEEIHAETLVGLDTSARHTPEQTEKTCCPILELRQYLHQPGRRDDFIALFDEYFIEEQEHYGAFILGQFRDRTHPDRFVWLRGFPDMQTRLTALEGFYHASPIWQAHRPVANDMISDVSNVFLLRPARVTTGFCFDPANRPMRGAPELAGGVIIVTIYTFDAPVDHFVTEPGENTFLELPVREVENVFVWFASFADEAAYTSSHAALTQSQEWITSIVPTLQTWGASSEEVLELLPTRRSLLRHRTQEQ